MKCRGIRQVAPRSVESGAPDHKDACAEYGCLGEERRLTLARHVAGTGDAFVLRPFKSRDDTRSIHSTLDDRVSLVDARLLG